MGDMICPYCGNKSIIFCGRRKIEEQTKKYKCCPSCPDYEEKMKLWKPR